MKYIDIDHAMYKCNDCNYVGKRYGYPNTSRKIMGVDIATPRCKHCKRKNIIKLKDKI